MCYLTKSYFNRPVPFKAVVTQDKITINNYIIILIVILTKKIFPVINMNLKIT